MATPLSDHAFEALGHLPIPAMEINPGVRWELLRQGYATIIMRESPYKTHKGAKIGWMDITEKGRRLLKDGI